MSLIERTPETRLGSQQPLWAGISALIGAVTRFTKNRMALHHMAEMDDSLLKDIGLTRHDVERAHMATVTQDPMAELKKAAAHRSARMYI